MPRVSPLVLTTALATLLCATNTRTTNAQDVERRPAGPLRTRGDAVLDSVTRPVRPPSGTATGTDNRHISDVSAPAPNSVQAHTDEMRRAYLDATKNARHVRPLDQTGWNAVARYTGYGYADLVKSYDAIYVVTFAYKYLLHHSAAPVDSSAVADLVKRQLNGEPWTHIWRDVAQSPERERIAGTWAPAPLEPSEVRDRFALGMTPGAEQCFGGLGDKCEGGIPGVYPSVQPRWHDWFTMPDGTEMGMVDIGVAVGSILHDNVCLRHHEDGLNCNGIGAGDLTKHPGWPAAMEWNKASWNVIDNRKWRETFGPYPTDKETRRSGWYDDLRYAKAREAWMAPVAGMLTTPAQTVRYDGAETRESARLKAPRGTVLDGKDAAFCRSQTFSSTQSPPLKAPLGICQ